MSYSDWWLIKCCFSAFCCFYWYLSGISFIGRILQNHPSGDGKVLIQMDGSYFGGGCAVGQIGSNPFYIPQDLIAFEAFWDANKFHMVELLGVRATRTIELNAGCFWPRLTNQTTLPVL